MLIRTAWDSASPAGNAATAEGDAPAAKKLPLPEHAIEWIDFGMMGTLTARQRQILIDIVTTVVKQDASALEGDGGLAVTITLRTIGFAGSIVSLFFALRLFREMKKGKQLSILHRLCRRLRACGFIWFIAFSWRNPPRTVQRIVCSENGSADPWSSSGRRGACVIKPFEIGLESMQNVRNLVKRDAAD